MPSPQLTTEPLMHIPATAALISALELLLQKAGDSLDKHQKIEILSVVIAAGCAVKRAGMSPS